MDELINMLYMNMYMYVIGLNFTQKYCTTLFVTFYLCRKIADIDILLKIDITFTILTLIFLLELFIIRCTYC